MNYKDELLYTKDNIWLKPNNNTFLIGITFFAQELLGDIIYLDLKLDSRFTKGSAIGSIESVKTVSDIVAPADGKIISINPGLSSSPEKINEAPHSNWICEIELVSDLDEKAYLSMNEYLELITNDPA